MDKLTMKASELRIGNWVYKPEADENTEMFAHGIAAFALAESIRKSEQQAMYEPIPLTPEWLEKFGFENGVEFQGGRLFYENEGITLEAPNAGNCLDFGLPCKYVHQLQNLYFALTGNELTLNNHEQHY